MNSKQNLAVSLAAWGAFAALASPLWAVDIVTQKSTNKQLIGEVGASNRTELTLTPKNGAAIKIPANDIASIKWEGEPAKLGIARGDEDRGNYDKALETYLEVHKDASGKLKTYLDFLIARTMARQSLDDPSRVDDAAKKLEAFLKSNAEHFGYFEATNYLGQVYAVKGDFAKAQAAFESLGKSPWNDFKMAAKIAVGRMQLKQNDVDGASKTFEDIASAKAESDSEKARKSEAQVGKIACIVKQSKHEEALKLLDEVIKATSADEARTMSEAYVLLGDCYQSQKKLKEAALAYLHVPVLYPKERAAHAEALFHLAAISPAIGQPQRGEEAREDLLANFPNSEWAKKLGAAPAAAPAADPSAKDPAAKDAAAKEGDAK